jgi:hypothetical protein
MSPPEKLPDDLWHDIERVTRHMAEFLAEAQHAAIGQEHRTGKVDVSFYAWLQPIATSVMELKKIERYGPKNNVLTFPRRVRPSDLPEAG